MSSCANEADNIVSSLLTLEVFVISILLTLILGGCIGYLIGKHYYLNSNNRRYYNVGASLSPSSDEVKQLTIPTAQQPPSRTQSMSISSQSSTTSNSTDDEPTYDWDGNDLGNMQLSLLNTIARRSCNEEEDGPTMVLRGSLDLMANKWGGEELIGTNNKDISVVEYLSPQQMIDLLFTKVTNRNDISETLCLDDCPANSNISNEQGDEVPSSPKSSTTDIINLLNTSSTDKSTISPTQFLNLLQLIQKYSVNTSHPYFFNQLFGSLDPIALAAEIVALSVNTSVYTYETAPVFTLLEREVMNQIGKLVFEHNGNRVEEGQEEEKFEGEGLMIPGGSLANLTAMHAARHRWKVMNGYTKEQQQQQPKEEEEEEDEDSHLVYNYNKSTCPDMVAFISSEAHYSFAKSARVLGIREDDLIVIPTHSDGRMDVHMLAMKMKELEEEAGASQGSRKRVPFFVACTAGSTVRGSFDQIGDIVKVCREYESRYTTTDSSPYERSIWVHVDGAWGGSAIFSSRPSLRASTHMDEIRLADSFTFNPHKMLGAPQQTTAFIVRHRNAMRNASAAGAKYLFDPRKNGAEYDLGDLSYTCGRRTDAVKLWALWKYYGKSGLGQRVDQKVDELELFVEEVQRRESFALACKPWPFNVNFFYFPPRIRRILKDRGVLPIESSKDANELDDYIQIPDDIAEDLSNVSVTLKLRLHEAGEMIIPYQVSDFCGYQECVILYCFAIANLFYFFHCTHHSH